MTTLHPSNQALFYLGAHQPHWLWRVSFPLFVSHRQLARRVMLHPATCQWALDSGGFTELQRHGRWTVTPEQYVSAVRRYRDQIGRLDWVAPQDWMCEPAIIHGGYWGGQHFAGTGLSVAEHQHRTVANYLHLRELAPEVPFIPVLQGWQLGDYLTCAELYQTAGVDLAALPRVGLGSVCRRQSTTEITQIVTTLARAGLRLHGFGVKTGGLHRYGPRLASADSMAWSYSARRLPALPGCTGHKNCANCLVYATRWRAHLLTSLTQRGQQGDLFDDLGRDAA
ncbi:deazapurine DNA modification protein DpdA family protein [Streptosporangium sp. NPDC003464]